MEAQSLASQLKEKRSEMIVSELEAVALRLFDERGFGEVNVEEIASTAGISVRTFYRYFGAKEDVLQVRIDKRNEVVGMALRARPADEAPLRSLRLALEEEAATVDTTLLRRWIAVISSTPAVLRGVVGGLHLKTHPIIAGFFATRLDVPADSLVPTMLAAAAVGVIQAATTQWFFRGGDLATTMSESFAVLESGIGTDWVPGSAGSGPPKRLT
ncbi:MAG TPA: TetR family transcriptional regulator [Acidimicrobiales bacterium]|nr:TetR family transcriptional regulator [Acidimicrobiales bacterium]